MQAKRQFHVSAEKRTFFDRKVLHYGSSRTIAMGKIIPKDWEYIRMAIVEQAYNTVTVKIERQYLGPYHARNPKTNKTSGQNP